MSEQKMGPDLARIGKFERIIIPNQNFPDAMGDPAGTDSSQIALQWTLNTGDKLVLPAELGAETSSCGPNQGPIRYSLIIDGDKLREFGSKVIPNFDPTNERQVEVLGRQVTGALRSVELLTGPTGAENVSVEFNPRIFNG